MNIECAVLNVSGKGITSSRPPRPGPRPPSPAVRTSSPSLWTPATWVCSSGRGPRIYEPAFGTGSPLAPEVLRPRRDRGTSGTLLGPASGDDASPRTPVPQPLGAVSLQGWPLPARVPREVAGLRHGRRSWAPAAPFRSPARVNRGRASSSAAWVPDGVGEATDVLVDPLERPAEVEGL